MGATWTSDHSSSEKKSLSRRVQRLLSDSIEATLMFTRKFLNSGVMAKSRIDQVWSGDPSLWMNGSFFLFGAQEKHLELQILGSDSVPGDTSQADSFATVISVSYVLLLEVKWLLFKLMFGFEWTSVCPQVGVPGATGMHWVARPTLLPFSES